MRRAIVPFFALIFVALLFLSLVNAEPSNPLTNEITMKSPFSTGSHSSDGSHRGDSVETHHADHDNKGGIIYAQAACIAGPGTGSSNAWADSNLMETFEIIHSSMYKITFGFDYKGMVEATALPGILTFEIRAGVNVILYVSLVNSQNGSTIFQKDEIIFEKEVTSDETSLQEISGSVVIEDFIQLENNNTYEWRAGIRTETNAHNEVYFEYGDPDYQTGLAQATANFFNKKIGYQVNIEEVRVEDLHPDNVAPTTTATLTGTAGEKGWYRSNVTIALNVTDDNPLNSYGINYTNQRINNGSWERYQSPFTITSEGLNIVEFYSVDKAKNEETPPKNVSIKIDKIPPVGEVTIDSGAELTQSATVTLIIQAHTEQENETTQMRIRNEGENWSSWRTYTSTPILWTLQSSNGTKRVYVQLKDEAGNISPEFYDDITLDLKNVPSPSPSPTPTSSPKPQSSKTLTPPPEGCTIIVYVKDSNNNIVEGATVTSITQPSGQSPLVGTSDYRGSVKFSKILSGSYIFKATKKQFGGNGNLTVAESQKTTSIDIVVKVDLTPPTISIDLEQASPQNSHQMVFTVEADDNIDGCGVSQITLYIDEKAVVMWTTEGIHIYTNSFSPHSSHSYYVEALDNADNKARYPTEENLGFSVPLNAAYSQFSLGQTKIWQILGGITILVMTAILILIGIKRKK